MNAERLAWSLVHYDRIAADDLYEVLALRQRVFVVEQHCAFLDADGVDRDSWHLLGRNLSRPVGAEYPEKMPSALSTSHNVAPLVAYLRIVPPGRRFHEPSIGRVVTAPEVRRQGLGRILMQEGIRRTRELYPGRVIKLSAQRYLEGFYGSLGFVVTGEPYDEDGIPHVDMALAEDLATDEHR